MDSSIPVKRSATPPAQRRTRETGGAQGAGVARTGPTREAEQTLVGTLRKTSGSIVVPLEKWLQTSGCANTPLGRIVSEMKAREERWVGVQKRLTADVTSTAEKLRQKTLSVETLEATLQADPGFRDWAKEIRRLRQQVRTSDGKLQERENDLRAVKERSSLEKAELEAAIRDAKTGDVAEKLKVQAEVRCCPCSSPLLLLLLLFPLLLLLLVLCDAT